MGKNKRRYYLLDINDPSHRAIDRVMKLGEYMSVDEVVEKIQSKVDSKNSDCDNWYEKDIRQSLRYLVDKGAAVLNTYYFKSYVFSSVFPFKPKKETQEYIDDFVEELLLNREITRKEIPKKVSPLKVKGFAYTSKELFYKRKIRKSEERKILFKRRLEMMIDRIKPGRLRRLNYSSLSNMYEVNISL